MNKNWLRQALSQVENQIDKVLDIQPADPSSAQQQNPKSSLPNNAAANGQATTMNSMFSMDGFLIPALGDSVSNASISPGKSSDKVKDFLSSMFSGEIPKASLPVAESVAAPNSQECVQPELPKSKSAEILSSPEKVPVDSHKDDEVAQTVITEVVPNYEEPPVIDETEVVAEEPQPEQQQTNESTPKSPEQPQPEPTIEATSLLSDKPETTVEETPTRGLVEPTGNDALGGDVELERLSRVVAERERQLETAMLQCATLNAQLDELRVQLSQQQYQDSSQPPANSDLKTLREELDEKEEIVKQLREEGEKLSLQNGKLYQTLKNLKQAHQQLTTANEKLTQEHADLSARFAELEDSVKQLQAESSQLIQRMKQLESDKNTAERKLAEVQGEYDQLKERNQESKNDLEKARDEILALKKTLAEAESLSQSTALESQTQLVQDLKQRMEKLSMEQDQTENTLRREIMDLRSQLSRVESEAGWKEDQHRKEIETLQHRLQESESHNEYLAGSIQDGTKPLLRQIEALQAQHLSTMKSFEATEQQLSSRIQAMESERESYRGQAKELQRTIDSLLKRVEVADQLVEQEKQARIKADLQMERHGSETSALNKRISDLQSKLDTIKSIHQQELERAEQRFDVLLRQKMEEERLVMNEQKRAMEVSIKEREQELERQKLKFETMKRQWGTEQQLSTDQAADLSASFSQRRGSNGSIGTPNLSERAIFSSVSGYHPSSRIQYESQLAILQSQLKSALQAKDELSIELVNLTRENDQLKSSIQHVDGSTLNNYAELEQKYLMSLEVLGEKTERVEELQQDIREMKEVYKAQVQELIDEVNALKVSR